MNFIKQKWVKTTLIVICWALFLWGIFIVAVVLSGGDFNALKDWTFYVFGILPIFTLIFVRDQVKKALSIIWQILPSKEWFYKNWFKLAGIILTVFIVSQYFSYLDRKNALDKEQLKREYVAKRKRDCLDIYQEEQKNWNNTQGYSYDDKEDVCRVSYKATDEWKGVKCEELDPLKNLSDFGLDGLSYRLRRYNNCTNNLFDKEF